MNKYFPEMKKNFGFGCMRFPTIDNAVDIPVVTKMVDAFLEAGFHYFDTAYFYHDGNSERVLKEVLTSRYPRESYILTDKLAFNSFKKAEDVPSVVEGQLEKCGVDYFDFYFYHALNAQRHAYYKEEGIYEVGKAMLQQGRFRHLGMSFHDSAEVLDEILTEHPEIEVVQLQLNYVDWIDPKIQSEKCWQVCRKHGKPVMVMEPVKGGALANLPEEAVKLMKDGSPASYALRFAAGCQDVVMVLSGMSDLQQVLDNIRTMTDFRPLTQEEHQMLEQVRTIYQGQNKIPCTACRYCVDGCPVGLDIPELFACLNAKHQKEEDPERRYAALPVKADACVGCGHCEGVCPQKLSIRRLLKDVTEAF